MKTSSLFIAAMTLGLFLGGVSDQDAKHRPIGKEDISAAEQLIRLEFTDAERDSMLTNLEEQASDYEKMRAISLANSVPPALNFNPIPAGFTFEQNRRPFRISRPGKVLRPRRLEDAAFWSIGQLAELLRTRQVTSVELTQM